MSDIVTSRIFTDGEIGITASKLNDIVASSVIQPAFVGSKPVASTTGAGDNLLLLKSNGTYAQIDSSVFATSIAAILPAPEPKIWSVRLRSFNALGNPNFEVDQRNAGAAVAVTPTVIGWVDRWATQLAGTTMRASSQQIAANVVLPGTNFLVTQSILRVTLTTLKASLAATDYLVVQQGVEGPQLRELLNDVHSVSILVRSSVANLKFGLYLQDSAGTHILTKLCTLGAANTWTLIQLPNLPIWMAAATWPLTPGGVGYTLGISLAAGSTYTASANDVWAASSAFGALGQSSFAAGPVNSTFDVAFVQHEPGAVCSTLMDKPFSQNFDECQRYYQKSEQYVTKPVTAGTFSNIGSLILGSTSIYSGLVFPKRMAKTPTMRFCGNVASPGVNQVYLGASSANVAVASSSVIDSQLVSVTLSAAGPGSGPVFVLADWDADTGW